MTREGNKELSEKPRPERMEGGWGRRTEREKGGGGDRSGTGGSSSGIENRKRDTTCGFLVARLLKIKRVNGDLYQCKYSADECRFHHIASLKEITRSEAIADAPHEGLKLFKDTAKGADRGCSRGND